MKTTEQIVIQTDRLILRRFCAEDLGEIAEVLGHPQVMRFSLSGPYSREKCEEFIQNRIDEYKSRGFGLYAVVLKSKRILIGYCGHFIQMVDSIEEVEIGYRLHPDFWNHGLATEAARSVRDHGFEYGYSRQISIIDSQNKASIRVAEKVGMKYEKDLLFKGSIPTKVYVIEKEQIHPTRVQVPVS